MSEFIKLMGTWDVWAQVTFLLLLAVFVLAGWCKLLDFLLHLLRGYPPTPGAPEKAAVEYDEEGDPLPTCDHADNLTGYCLRGGGCKTVAECNAEVARHDGEE